MAIAAQYQTVQTFTTTAALYTVPTSGNFGTYARDLIITNSGTASCYVAFGAATSAVTTSSFVIPTGGSIVLTECQVPSGSAQGVIFGVQAVATTNSQVSIGFCSVVSVI